MHQKLNQLPGVRLFFGIMMNIEIDHKQYEPVGLERSFLSYELAEFILQQTMDQIS